MSVCIAEAYAAFMWRAVGFEIKDDSFYLRPFYSSSAYTVNTVSYMSEGEQQSIVFFTHHGSYIIEMGISACDDDDCDMLESRSILVTSYIHVLCSASPHDPDQYKLIHRQLEMRMMDYKTLMHMISICEYIGVYLFISRPSSLSSR